MEQRIETTKGNAGYRQTVTNPNDEHDQKIFKGQHALQSLTIRLNRSSFKMFQVYTNIVMKSNRNNQKSASTLNMETRVKYCVGFFVPCHLTITLFIKFIFL